MKHRIIVIIAALFFLTQIRAYAALELELTQGVNGAIPIAIVPFGGSASGDATSIASIIQSDLKHSGRFNVLPQKQIRQFPNAVSAVNYPYWKGTGVNNVVVGDIKPTGIGRYRVTFSLLDVFRGAGAASGSSEAVLVSDEFVVSSSQMRRLAHHISDVIYQKLTGEKGIFSTSLAYVLVQRSPGVPPKYILEVADVDGFNPRPLLISRDPIMSPTWSPDGKQVAYVSFENRRAGIYVEDVASGKRHLLSAFPGINGAPAWSPDGKELAFVLSKSGAPNIYIYNLASKQLRQTTSGININTEPSWAPNGKSILFTSNRGGGPQVYQLVIDSGKIQRLTFNGKYNASASFIPGGNAIVLLHQTSNGYDIATQNLSGSLRVLTTAGNASSPSVAPNGRMILYAANNGAKGELEMVSSDSKIRLRLPAPEGTVQAPAWSR